MVSTARVLNRGVRTILFAKGGTIGVFPSILLVLHHRFIAIRGRLYAITNIGGPGALFVYAIALSDHNVWHVSVQLARLFRKREVLDFGQLQGGVRRVGRACTLARQGVKRKGHLFYWQFTLHSVKVRLIGYPLGYRMFLNQITLFIR